MDLDAATSLLLSFPFVRSFLVMYETGIGEIFCVYSTPYSTLMSIMIVHATCNIAVT